MTDSEKKRSVLISSICSEIVCASSETNFMWSLRLQARKFLLFWNANIAWSVFIKLILAGWITTVILDALLIKAPHAGCEKTQHSIIIFA